MARLRFQCRDCAKSGKGGFFSIKGVRNPSDIGEVKCPYCGSKNVKLLSTR